MNTASTFLSVSTHPNPVRATRAVSIIIILIEMPINRAVCFLIMSLNLVAKSAASNETDGLLFDTFPSSFMWAVGSSAYQTEGAPDVDGITI